MWDKELSRELAYILETIADPPNLRPDPQNPYCMVFDGGKEETITGAIRFEFSSGARAFYGTGLNYDLHVTLSSREEVSINVSSRMCTGCGARVRDRAKYCRRCGAALNSL